MTSKEIVHHLVAETAGMLQAGRVKACEERDAWLLALDGETMLDIEFDSVEDRLIITGDVCEVAEPARPLVYEMLLQYNYLWTETGGVRMALGGGPGNVVMMFELPAVGLQPSRLCHALNNMAHSQRAWQHVLPLISG